MWYNFLTQMELNIAFLAKVNGDHSVSKRFFDASRARKKAMELIFWKEEMGQWNDYWFDTSAVKVLLDFIYLFCKFSKLLFLLH